MRDHIEILSALVRRDTGIHARLLALNVEEDHAFARFAIENRVSCYLYAHLSEQGILGQCPPVLRKRLTRQHAQQERKSARAIVQLTRLSELFSRSGIPFMLLKGIYWSERFHGGPNRRNTWDIDLLVSAEAAHEAEQVLNTVGFHRKSSTLLGAKLTRRFTHAFDFSGPGMSIDLHWSLSRHPAFRINYEKLWRDCQAFQIAGLNLNVLPDQIDLVFALISILKDLERDAVRLKAFVDLYVMLRQLEAETNWDAFFDAREKEGLAAICINVLWCFFEVFDCANDFPVISSVIKNRREGSTRATNAFDLLQPTRFGFANKRWASGLYDCSLGGYVSWWCVSLPFRIVVHRQPKKNQSK